ncbi:hypothetical protein [Alkalihalobacillus trypoxylicola]|uniref:Uncharacterized protein n=1 Tax=Alkalihalobacillus trypoxylicola TaxID=519424 RepID=A0A162ENV9_9BACI|nr:hypothetical protein [Alkalihalobacillus trypoxylicola]KYG33370.1 hypothetical protein AZF04_16790 [Alkalihalobacillus trypoxylicola]
MKNIHWGIMLSKLFYLFCVFICSILIQSLYLFIMVTFIMAIPWIWLNIYWLKKKLHKAAKNRAYK